LFGDQAELHNRIMGKNDFEKTTQLIKEEISKDHCIKIIIGISRYNFFKANEIVKFCFSLILKKQINDVGVLNSPFNIFPLKDLPSNFFLYLDSLKKITKKFCNNIEINLLDVELKSILEIIGLNAYLYPEREKDLARLLGIICENIFIGPQTIVVDPFHRCNVKCVHCFVHNPLIYHPEEFLDRKIHLSLFKEIINDAAALRVDEIILQGDGEPLMHPNFLDMISYARQKGIRVIFFTNGCFLNEKIAEEIINLGVTQIYCSLPAASEESYEKICISPQKKEWFYIIVKNMKSLVKLKNKFKKKFPVLTMTHVIHRLNFHELIKMAELDACIGADAVRFYLIRIDENNEHLKLEDNQIENIKIDLAIVDNILKKAGIEFIDNIRFQLSHYENSTGSWSKDIFLQEGCTIGWYFCLIPALGDISMCCHLRTVGYLDKNRFKEIWLSDYYRKKRYQAKFISDYQDVEFLNGMTLYNEHCEHCDNHQNLLKTIKNLKSYGLYKFFGNNVSLSKLSECEIGLKYF